jgi:hypothetical protein
MSANRQKINAASKATDVVIEAYHNAARSLNRSVHYNGFGVLADVSMVRNNLFEARDEINKALSAISGCSWPTDADYGEG